MKRLILCLLILMLPCAALANSWGAPGDTIELFEKNPEYEDYTSVANDYARNLDAGLLNGSDKVQLVMENRYHRQLICAEKVDGHWRMTHASTAAVHQPGSGKDERPKLERTSEGFILRYSDEYFEFALQDDEWVLWYAAVSGLSFAQAEYGFRVSDGSYTATWQIGESWDRDAALRLADFNISLFPRSLDEVRRLNELRAIIADGGGLLSEPMTTVADKSLPVYSAPSEESWRGAEGKASVNLRDTEGLHTFGMVEGWQMIEYKVSLRTSRVGYIQEEGPELNDVMHPTAVMAERETWLTDDPHVSQYHQMTIPANTTLTALDCYGCFYAYVETNLDGKVIRGFVPLRDLNLQGQSRVFLTDQLAGAWRGPDGDYLALGDMGNFTSYRESADGTLTRQAMGSWDAFVCQPERFGNEFPYALKLNYEDGRADYLGVSLGENAITIYGEANASYQRVTGEQSEIEYEMMARIAGTYEIWAGGSMLAGDSFTLNADGTIQTHDDPAYTGTWYLTRYNPAEGYIWNDPTYTIYISLDNGYTCRRGCTYDWYDWFSGNGESMGLAYGVGVSLTNEEGGGSYVRVDSGFKLMAEAAGHYKLASGDAVMTDYLRLHPDGTLEVGTDDWCDTVGTWMVEPGEEADAPYAFTFRFREDSRVHAGETMRLNADFTPAAGSEPAVITFAGEAGSSAYVWYEGPGHG